MTGAFPEDTSALDAWAKAHVEGWRGPATVKKFPTGQSNPTYLIEAKSGRYVLRRKPPGKLLKRRTFDRARISRAEGAREGSDIPLRAHSRSAKTRA